MKNSLRQDDLVARLGGDEFIAVLHITSDDIILNKANSLCKNPNWKLSFTESLPSASIGVTIVEGDYQLQNIIEKADSALYRAKQDGKGVARLYGGEKK